MKTEQESKSVIFHTNGVINPGAWELMGLSVKTSAESIGMFGTGFKYAISVLLRTGHEVSIHCESGKIYEFGLEQMEFRGQEFQRVVCNGKQLSFTTHYGFKWNVDQAYRELMSNTMDESGVCFIGDGPLSIGTSIVIKGPDIIDSHKNNDRIFIGEREPIAKTKTVNFYVGKGDVWFRGVKVSELQNSNYSYEVIANLDLTEDRTMANIYSFRYIVGLAICQQLTDKGLIEKIITSKGIEEEFDYDNGWSKEMTDAVNEVWKNRPTSLNKKIVSILRQRNPSSSFAIKEMTEDENEMVAQACEFLKEAGYSVDCQIHRVDSTDPNVIAYYYDGAMHLTDNAFESGTFELVQTIFEESCHHRGLADYTLEFQQFLIKQVIIQCRKRIKKSI
jgi:hypothetical protein